MLLSVVSHWTADNTADDAVGGNDATLVSGATYATGQIGQAFSFDGVDDRALIADDPSLQLTQSMTIEGWIRVDSFPTDGHGLVLFRGDDRGGLDPYQMTTTPDGKIRFEVSSLSSGKRLEALMPQGEFVYVAGTLDDATGEMGLYLNGVPMAHAVTSVRPFGDLDPASNPGIGIGNHGGYPTTPHNFPFHGLIDELKVHDQALSGEEVLANFNAGKGSWQPSISIDDVTVTEGVDTPAFIDDFIPAGSGGLYAPKGLAIGPDGDLYVAASNAAQVLRYDGESGSFLGVFADGSVVGSDLYGAEVLFGPDGNLYLSTGGNHSVLQFDGTSGEYLGEFVPPGFGGLSKAWGMGFGPDGDLYVGSAGTNEVLRYGGPLGAAPGTFLGMFASGNGLVIPWDVTFGSDANLYVASSASDEVLRFQGPGAGSPGTFIDAFIPAGSGGLDAPRGLTFHDNGDLYVVSAASNQVLRYDATGTFIDAYADADGGLAWPIAAVFGSDGNLLVSSRDTHDVQRYGPASQAVFTLNLSAPSPDAVTVTFNTAEDTVGSNPATANVDYTTTGGTVVFDPGTTIRTIIVPTIDDTDVETTDETFLVNLSNPSSGAIIVDGQGVGTIQEDVPRFLIDDVQQLEGDGGTTVFTFTVTFAGDRPAELETASVDWATQDGTATENVDYVGVAANTLNFLLGETEKQVSVTVNGDTDAEDDETFFVNLSNAVGAPIEDAQGIGTIVNDDWSISIDDVTVVEGDDSAHFRGVFVDFPAGQNFLSLTFGPDGLLYTSSQIGGGAIDRYDDTTGEFVDTFIPSGHIIGVRDPLFRDGFLYVGDEYTDEVLRFDATNGGFVDVFVAAGSGGIDGPHGMSFGPDANGDGVTELYVTGRNSANVVRYDGVTGQPVGSYVTSGSGGLSLPEGLAFDPTESFVFVASAGSGDVLKYDAATGAFVGIGAGSPLSSPKDVIFGSDGLMYVSSAGNDRIIRFTSDGALVDDFVPAGVGGMDDPNRMIFGPDGDLYVSGPGIKGIMRFGTEMEAVFTATLSSPSNLPVSVNFSTADGTAEAGTDYTDTGGTLTFDPGITSRTILVPVLEDGIAESPETFVVDLDPASVVNAAVADGQGVATIMEVTTYQSTDVPKDLKDGKNAARPGVITSIIEATGPGKILDLNVQLDITHTWDADLTVTLFAPDGTPVELFSNVGWSLDNFTSTVLDDAAATPITAGTPPFTGAFQPEGSLAAFNDLDAAGTWTLEIIDSFRDNTGTLDSWSIEIATYLPELNNPPVAVDDSATTDEDTAVVIAVLSNDSDPNGDSIYVDSVTDGTDGSVTINPDDTVIYTPNADFNGIDTFTYTVADGKGGSTTGTVTVTVDPVADPPDAVDDVDSTTVGTAVTIDVLQNDSDPDGDVVSVVSVGVPTSGSAVDNGDGTVTYTPNPGTSGSDSFTYTISDGDPTTADATAIVTVDVQSIPSELEFTSSGDPMVIGDLKTVSSPIVVSGTSVTVDGLTVRINLTHANPSDLTAQLISSTGSTLDINGPILSGDYVHEYVVSGATGVPLDGTWTLQVTDNLKNRKRGSLIEWTMTATPLIEGAAPSSQSAAAFDMALAAWADSDSSDDENDPLATQAADELALMLLA